MIVWEGGKGAGGEGGGGHALWKSCPVRFAKKEIMLTIQDFMSFPKKKLIYYHSLINTVYPKS